MAVFLTVHLNHQIMWVLLIVRKYLMVRRYSIVGKTMRTPAEVCGCQVLLRMVHGPTGQHSYFETMWNPEAICLPYVDARF